jgi:hypothetical protein
MKKTTALLFAVLLAIVPLSAQATAERPIISISSYEEWLAAGVQNGWVVNSQIVQRNTEQSKPAAEPAITEEAPAQKPVAVESIAIIDQQFNASALSGNYTEICVSACDTNQVPRKDQLADFNHGTQMAEIIRKNNPSAHLVLIRAGATNASPVTSLGLRDALAWIVSNHSKHNIKVVSASINAGNSNTCSPTGGVSFSEVSSRISALKSSGISVIASAGNVVKGKTLNYPACITDVVAVSSANRQGLNAPELDFIVRPDASHNFQSSAGPVAINSLLTTSVATALVAANWKSLKDSSVNSRLQITVKVLK